MVVLKYEPEEKSEHPLIKLTAAHQMLGSYINLFCAGCGYGTIAQCICRALARLKDDPFKYPKFVGIGCHSLLAFLVPGPSMQVLHGRAIPFATGVKLANPEVKPIVITGDGDCLGIGTNHFVHAARRNVDITVLLINNFIYGMTGGQVAPTTPKRSRTSTSPYGNIERTLDAVDLAKTCGATYIARWTVAHPRQLTGAISEAVQHRGFSIIEILSQCVTYFGRFNQMRDPVTIYRWLKNNSVKLDQAEKTKPEELRRKVIIGKFVENKNVLTWREEYKKIVKEAQR